MRRWLLTGAIVAMAAAPSTAGAATTPLSQFGTSGSGAGQLDVPVGTDVSPVDGTVSVTEFAGSRISQFTPGGQFIHAFGWDVVPGNAETGFEICTVATTCKTGVAGAGAGQLNHPQSVTSDPAGNLYVSDSGSSRISVFSPSGEFLRAFGWDVIPANGAPALETCTAGTGCQAGTGGNTPGQLSTPTGLALDGQGQIYVSELLGYRVDVFTVGGAFVRSLGTPGVAGAAAGQVPTPQGLALDSAGNVYVADTSLYRVDEFNSSGAFVSSFGWDVNPVTPSTAFEVCTTSSGCKTGVSGPGVGQFGFPSGLGIDAQSDVLVGDLSDNRVSRFSPGPQPLDAFGFDVVPANAETGFEICTTACQVGTGTGTAFGEILEPNNLTVDCRGAIWIPDSTLNRVQRFGEPGTPLPPCPAVSPGPEPAPSNAFSIGKLVLNRKAGTAKLAVTLPGAGNLVLNAKMIVLVKRQIGGPGTVKLPIRVKPKGRKALRRTGKAVVAAKVSFTPTGGLAASKTRSLTLRKRHRH